MGMFDDNMDTALALNSHGGLVKAKVSRATLKVQSYLPYGSTKLLYVCATDNTANDVTNTDRGDYSIGVQ